MPANSLLFTTLQRGIALLLLFGLLLQNCTYNNRHVDITPYKQGSPARKAQLQGGMHGSKNINATTPQDSYSGADRGVSSNSSNIPYRRDSREWYHDGREDYRRRDYNRSDDD